MPARNVVIFEEQTGVTGTSDAFIVQSNKEVGVAVVLTSGTPTTGCRVQITLDEPHRIADGSAAWVNSPLGNHTLSNMEKMLRPVTGVRLVATDGTWTVQVRQY